MGTLTIRHQQNCTHMVSIFILAHEKTRLFYQADTCLCNLIFFKLKMNHTKLFKGCGVVHCLFGRQLQSSNYQCHLSAASVHSESNQGSPENSTPTAGNTLNPRHGNSRCNVHGNFPSTFFSFVNIDRF